jgi:SCP1.201-like deaminase
VSINEVIAALCAAAARAVPPGLAVAVGEFEGAAAMVRNAAEGSSQPEAAEAAGWLDQATARAIEAHQACVAAQDSIGRIIAALTPAAGAAGSPGTVDHDRPQPPSSVQSPHGDRYPVRSKWAAHLMDRYSPPRSGLPVRGMVRVAGQDQTFEFKPGAEFWAKKAYERVKSLQVPERIKRSLGRISTHVEFQVAAWMVESGHTEVEVCINRTPCGYRKDLSENDGCHQFLQGFLPGGCRIHLYGTDDNGKKAYIATYEGKNDR